MTPSKNPGAGYEQKDIRFGVLLMLLGLLFVVIGLTGLIAHRLHKGLLAMNRDAGAPLSPMADMHRLPPEPRLQVSPAVDMVRLRDVEDVTLNNYNWINPQEGTVRIPIQRAMDLIARRGLPARSRGEEPQ